MSDAPSFYGWTDEQLDAGYAAFRAHERGVEFNEFGEHVCSECGYAYSWPEGADGKYKVSRGRSGRHFMAEALRAMQALGSGVPAEPLDAGPSGSGHSPSVETVSEREDSGGSVEDPSTHLIHGPASAPGSVDRGSDDG